METNYIKKITAQNYKNLRLDEGLLLDNLNIFIGPNGSGKSNLIGVLKFLRSCITDLSDETTGRTGFEDAIFNLGGSKILDAALKPPTNVKLKYDFELGGAGTETPSLELALLVPGSQKEVIISQEILYTHRDLTNKEPFYYYKSHDRTSGQGVVSVYDSVYAPHTTHFEKLPDVAVNQLTLVTISKLLESSNFPPENTPIYQIRRQLLDTISQWHFYNANDMNLEAIRHSEPKVGPGDTFLSRSGENLPRMLHNLTQSSLDFEENINEAMRAILPTTRRVRAVASGRLSLTVEWHFDNIKEPFYLNELSDGTVRMLSWATVLHSPTLPTLLVIDEPEIGVHVAWMPILAEWIKTTSQKTQLIICTHSPDLLDHFTDSIENVSVFCIAGEDKNHFEIKPLSKENLTTQLEKGWQLGDLYRVGDPSVGGWPW